MNSLLQIMRLHRQLHRHVLPCCMSRCCWRRSDPQRDASAQIFRSNFKLTAPIAGNGSICLEEFQTLTKDGVLLHGTLQQYSGAFEAVDSDHDGAHSCLCFTPCNCKPYKVQSASLGNVAAAAVHGH